MSNPDPKQDGYLEEGGKPYTPDIDICSACGEHAEFEQDSDGHVYSNCCGAGEINTDPDIDMER